MRIFEVYGKHMGYAWDVHEKCIGSVWDVPAVEHRQRPYIGKDISKTVFFNVRFLPVQFEFAIVKPGIFLRNID